MKEQELQELLDQQFLLIEERQNAQEGLLANLMLAYAELSSTVEIVIGELMSPRSEAEREAFRRNLEKRHLETLNMIREVTSEVDGSTPGDDLSTAVKMATEQSGSSSDS